MGKGMGTGWGCAVVVDSAHMCMVARGVERFAASTMTFATWGLGEEEVGDAILGVVGGPSEHANGI